MLLYFNAKQDQNAINKFDVSVSSLAISIMLSLLHTVLEGLFIWIESKATKTSFMNYTIICFNGRFGWVPYNYFLVNVQQKMLQSSSSSNKNIDLTDEKRIELDFQNITTNVLCISMEVEFVFTDSTLLALSKPSLHIHQSR